MEALRMVDEAYADREEWIKKSIRTTAKVSTLPSFVSEWEDAKANWICNL